jgi:hypothetical protein
MNTDSPFRGFAKVALVAAGLTAGTALAYASTACNLKVIKFYDANANGRYDKGDSLIPGWPMTLGTGSSATSTRLTNSYGYALWSKLPVGSHYWVAEGKPLESNWVQSAPVDGTGNPINPVKGIKLVSGKTTYVKFGNYCMGGSGGRTPGFWSNKNGHRTMLDELNGAEEELALLRSLNLVDANGRPFNPTTHAQFRSWLLGGNATNMAYKLSTHLAAMALNVEAAFVDGKRTYLPFGGTINELIALANASLASDPFTPPGDEERAIQEQLKNHLDALNNGAAAVASKPCKRTFSATY